MTVMMALKDRLRGEFQQVDGRLVSFGDTPCYAAAITTDDEGSAIVQALDFVTGDLKWEVTLSSETPLELMLVVARSAAAGDR